MSESTSVLVIAGLMVLALVFLASVLAKLYRKAGPHEALIVYGFRGTRIIKGHGSVIFPMVETCKVLGWKCAVPGSSGVSVSATIMRARRWFGLFPQFVARGATPWRLPRVLDRNASGRSKWAARRAAAASLSLGRDGSCRD